VTVAASPGAPKWSDPVVLIAGPVRTVVEVHCTGFQAKEGDQVTLAGDVTHYISVWNDLPCVDFEEAVSYTAPGYDFTWGYYGGEALGKSMDENDRLIAPLMNQAYAVKLPSREAGPYQQFYDTWVPEEGWYALQDTGEKTGLATFYETLAEIHARDEWVAYRPAWNPVLHMRTSPGRPEISLSFKDRALRCRTEWDRNLRYFFLREEKPEEIRFQYACWAQPLDTAGKVSAPEQQK
jgi:hypothetical protein